MFVSNGVKNDPRVTREAGTLARAGFDVVVFGLWQAEGTREEEYDGYRIVLVPYPQLRTYRDTLLVRFQTFAPRMYKMARSMYRAIPIIQHIRKSKIRSNNTQPAQIKIASELKQNTSWTLNSIQIELLNIRWLLRMNLALVKAAKTITADIYHAHDLDTLLAATLLKIRAKKPLIYDFHELYTEQFRKGAKSPLWHLFYTSLERMLVRLADVKLTVCDSLAEWVCRRYRCSQVTTIMNVPSRQRLPTVRSVRNRKKVILYHGMYFADRGLEQLIEAASFLKDAQVVLRGFGVLENELRALVKARRLDEVVSFAPPVKVADLVRTAAEADIGMATFLPTCLNTYFCLPNKFFEYMLAGLAIVATDLPELRRIVVTHDCGVLCNPQDPVELGRTLNELIADNARLEKMQQNARYAAETMFNWESEGPKIVRLYDNLLGVNRSCHQAISLS